MKLISQLGESKILGWIESLSSKQKDSRLITGPGDDAALVKVSPGRVLVVTTDEMVEGTHFTYSPGNASLLARKLVRINLSDLAAMGNVRPLAAVAGAGLPKSLPWKWVKDFTRALIKESNRFGMSLAGGNLAKSDRLHVYMAAFGEAVEKETIGRSGAGPWDGIFSVGPLGDARAGLEIHEAGWKNHGGLQRRFLLPEPLLKEGAVLGKTGFATSLIDNSDGLLRSVEILSGRAGCSAEIELGEGCASKELKRYCGLNNSDWREYAVAGGEDYGLIFTVSTENEKKLRSALPDAVRIGTMKKGRGVKIKGYSPEKKIFEHFK